MSSVGIKERPGALRPLDLPTLYLSEMVGSWWDGLPRYCTRICGGRLWLTWPDQWGNGEVACLNCTRVVATVHRRRPDTSPIGMGDRRGRPRIYATDADYRAARNAREWAKRRAAREARG